MQWAAAPPASWVVVQCYWSTLERPTPGLLLSCRLHPSVAFITRIHLLESHITGNRLPSKTLSTELPLPDHMAHCAHSSVLHMASIPPPCSPLWCLGQGPRPAEDPVPPVQAWMLHCLQPLQHLEGGCWRQPASAPSLGDSPSCLGVKCQVCRQPGTCKDLVNLSLSTMITAEAREDTSIPGGSSREPGYW